MLEWCNFLHYARILFFLGETGKNCNILIHLGGCARMTNKSHYHQVLVQLGEWKHERKQLLPRHALLLYLHFHPQKPNNLPTGQNFKWLHCVLQIQRANYIFLDKLLTKPCYLFPFLTSFLLDLPIFTLLLINTWQIFTQDMTNLIKRYNNRTWCAKSTRK